jgi:hypothetical protein
LRGPAWARQRNFKNISHFKKFTEMYSTSHPVSELILNRIIPPPFFY